MNDALYLEDGKLVVYMREQTYYARIRVGSKRYIWRSLKTRDKSAARKAATKLFYNLEFKQEQGLPIKSMTVNAVIDEYVAMREKQHKQGRTSAAMLRQVKRVVKFWRVYMGSKAIDSVGDKELREYVQWRKDYYSKQKTLPKNAKLVPQDRTLQWEIMLGKAIIKWATERGLRGNKPNPTYAFTPKVKRVRPAFELTDYRKLWRAMLKRIKTCPNEGWKQSRELLRDYVLILANSGMRVGEANNMKMRDVVRFTDDKGRRNYRFIVRGKTGERDVILRATAAKYVDRLLARRNGAASDEPLFAMRDGSKIITLIDQFDEVLEEAGITHSSNGNKYTLYSLRHFYAVMALRKGLGVFEVARNMGTSVQMIQSYYGKHATAQTFATRLGD
jgi:integrase